MGTSVLAHQGRELQGCGLEEGPDRKRSGGRCCSLSRLVKNQLVVPSLCALEETVVGRRGFLQIGESVVCARCKDYSMGCWREAVPIARLPVRFELFHYNRSEGLCVLQTHCDFTEDSCESGVILGYGLVGIMLMSEHDHSQGYQESIFLLTCQS